MEKYIKLVFKDKFGENLCRVVESSDGDLIEIITTVERLKETLKNYLEK